MSKTGLDTLFSIPDVHYARSEKADSIARHLRCLFNSRRGSVAHLPLYGLPDISQIYQELPDSLYGFIEAIRETVIQYEPRLSHVRVSPVPIQNEDCVIHIRISGVLAAGDTIQFETYFVSGGAVQLFSRTSD